MTLLFSSHIERLRNKTEKKLNEYTTDSRSFYVLILLSALIAAAGLILNNTSIVIGAMVVAPLVTPIFQFSLALILFRVKTIGMASFSLLIGSGVAILASYLLTKGIAYIDPFFLELTSEMIARTEPNILFFLVALFSGMAGAYAYTHPTILTSITGIAIAVAVIPPLVVSGIGFALGETSIATNAISFYSLNLSGICFGSILMFLTLGFGKEIDT